MATAQPSLFDATQLPLPPVQRWWRLQGQARRAGRRVEPMLVTPRFLARIDGNTCPVTRTSIGPRAGRVVALREDADFAAGHLVTLGPVAASAPGGRWQDAREVARRLAAEPGEALEAGLDVAGWNRLALLRSFVQAVTPTEAAALPLHVLPPNRLRVLSPVQGLQVALTLALRGPDRAERLSRLAALAVGEDTRLALRVFVMTLLARRPVDLDQRAPAEIRCTLEDLWADPLLQRRWHRLATRLTDAEAGRLLQRAREADCLSGGWRPLEAGFAIDGWAAPARSAERRARPESAHADHAALASPRLASLVLGPMCRRHPADAGAPTTRLA